MKNKPILIVAGDSKSVFFEIFFKTLKISRFKSPLILVTSQKFLKSQMKKFNYKKSFNLLKSKEIYKKKLIIKN